MQEPTEGGVDAPAAEGNGEDITATIAEVVKSQLAEALAPLREDVEMVRRNKLDSRNKKLNDELKARDEELAQLRQQVQQLSPESAQTKDSMLETLRADFKQEIERRRKLEEDFQATQSKLRRKELEDLVLGDVAPEHRETALDLMEGTLHRNRIDINEPDTDLEQVADLLRKRIRPTLAIPGTKTGEPKASPTKPDAPTDAASIRWEQYQSWSEVPSEIKPLVPAEVFSRLVPTNGKSGSGTSGIGL